MSRNRDLHEAESSPDGRYVRFDEKLGSGAYKEVYLCYDTETGKEAAWNTVNLARLPKHERDRIRTETEILKELSHPHIINFYNVWENPEKDQICFTTEIVTSGTLKDYVSRVKAVKLKVIKKWCRQILNGLDYLHSHNPPIIHRDLKCDNIFVNGSQGELRIGDFGLSAARHTTHVESVLGTPEFMAPELYDEDYTEKVDIYAFGMCVLEMTTKEYPFEECTNAAQIWKRVSKGDKPDVLSRIKDWSVRSFIEICLSPAGIRLSAKELLRHPFLRFKRSDTAKDNLIVYVDPKPIGEPNRERSAQRGAPTNRNGDSSPTSSSPTNAPQNPFREPSPAPSPHIQTNSVASNYDKYYNSTPTHAGQSNTPSAVAAPRGIQRNPSHNNISGAAEQKNPGSNPHSRKPSLIHNPPLQQSNSHYPGPNPPHPLHIPRNSVDLSIKPIPLNSPAPQSTPSDAKRDNKFAGTSAVSHHHPPINARQPTINTHPHPEESPMTPSNSSRVLDGVAVDIDGTLGSVAQVVLHVHFQGLTRQKKIKFNFDFRNDTSSKIGMEMVKALKLPDETHTADLIASTIEGKIEPHRHAYFDQIRAIEHEHHHLTHNNVLENSGKSSPPHNQSAGKGKNHGENKKSADPNSQSKPPLSNRHQRQPSNPLTSGQSNNSHSSPPVANQNPNPSNRQRTHETSAAADSMGQQANQQQQPQLNHSQSMQQLNNSAVRIIPMGPLSRKSSQPPPATAKPTKSNYSTLQSPAATQLRRHSHEIPIEPTNVDNALSSNLASFSLNSHHTNTNTNTHTHSHTHNHSMSTASNLSNSGMGNDFGDSDLNSPLGLTRSASHHSLPSNKSSNQQFQPIHFTNQTANPSPSGLGSRRHSHTTDSPPDSASSGGMQVRLDAPPELDKLRHDQLHDLFKSLPVSSLKEKIRALGGTIMAGCTEKDWLIDILIKLTPDRNPSEINSKSGDRESPEAQQHNSSATGDSSDAAAIANLLSPRKRSESSSKNSHSHSGSSRFTFDQPILTSDNPSEAAVLVTNALPLSRQNSGIPISGGKKSPLEFSGLDALSDLDPLTHSTPAKFSNLGVADHRFAHRSSITPSPNSNSNTNSSINGSGGSGNPTILSQNFLFDSKERKEQIDPPMKRGLDELKSFDPLFSDGGDETAKKSAARERDDKRYQNPHAAVPHTNFINSNAGSAAMTESASGVANHRFTANSTQRKENQQKQAVKAEMDLFAKLDDFSIN